MKIQAGRKPIEEDGEKNEENNETKVQDVRKK